MSKRKEIIIGGFGGQGIVLAGTILGKAATLYEKKYATMTQDYGPESRGGACRSQIIISNDPISYPYIEKEPTALVLMSQEALNTFSAKTGKETVVIIDSDLVKMRKGKRKMYSIPATRIAQELGMVAAANIAMLGFVIAITRAVSLDAIKKTVMETVPKATVETNMKAFERGYSYGLEQIKAG